MREVILDKDILSYVLDGRNPSVAATAKQYLRVFRRFTVCSISICEVVSGLYGSRREERLAEFITMAEEFEVVNIGISEAILAGKILASLRASGTPIGNLDPLIAASAICSGRPLVSNNQKHYERIVRFGFQLKLENWAEVRDLD